MRLVTAALLAAPLSMVVCNGKPEAPPDPNTITSVELHAWSQRRKSFSYWITSIEVEGACVSSESVTDDMLHLVRDCSFEEQLRPRLNELLAVFEQAEELVPAGEQLAEEGDGHAAVFVRLDGTRWTADSKLLTKGAEFLSADSSEWLLLGVAAEPPTPSAAGWTQLHLRDKDGILDRQLGSDGRWSCESWLVTEETLEHVIVTRRGRIDPARAATLLDGFAAGLTSEEDAKMWTATLTPADPGNASEQHGDHLVARWDQFATELDTDCTLDPLPKPPKP